VLIKLRRVDKTTPQWDPRPLTVTAVKGSMVSASRSDLLTTRNSSFFKRVTRDPVDDADDQSHMGVIQDTGPIARATPDPTILDQETEPLATPNDTQTIDPPGEPAAIDGPVETEQQADPTDIEGPVETVQQAGQATTVPPTAGRRGRPPAEQTRINNEIWAANYAARRAANPPTRNQHETRSKLSLQNGGEDVMSRRLAGNH
jgi:hypothetical protein